MNLMISATDFFRLTISNAIIFVLSKSLGDVWVSQYIYMEVYFKVWSQFLIL